MKVTLWYTGLIVILMVFILSIILASSDKLLLFNMENQLQSTVKEAFEEIEIKDEKLHIDDDLEYFDDGISLLIYDQQGKRVAGTSPANFNSTASLKADHIQKISIGKKEWLVYDLPLQINGENQVWVRGVLAMNQLSSTMNMILMVTLISFPFLILIAGFGGYFITRRAFRPVQQMISAANDIKDGKDLTKRLDLQGSSKDEIYQLAQTFDSMFDRLQTSFDSEKQFTSDASHELRTPTAVIISQSEYALSQREDPKEMEESLQVILKQSRKMSSLISQLLLLARADRAKGNQFIFERINFSELTEIVTEELMILAEENNIQITNTIEENLYVKADQTLLTRLLMNLLTNAITYGKPNGTVKVRLFQQQNEVVCEIEDDGIGISEHHLEKIWDRFYRVDASRTSSENGNTGLGLSMVKWIVELHRGTISVESELGRGSTFIFRLPLE